MNDSKTYCQDSKKIDVVAEQPIVNNSAKKGSTGPSESTTYNGKENESYKLMEVNYMY